MGKPLTFSMAIVTISRRARKYAYHFFFRRMIPLDVTIEIGQRGSAKVAEVVEALLGAKDFPHRGVRSALLAGVGTPLDLPQHRKRSTLAYAPEEAAAQ